MPPFHFATLRQRLAQLWHPEHLHTWGEALRARGGTSAFVAQQLQIFVFTARTVSDGEITRRAAGLTYHTLLAIVPVLAVAFALFKAFGGLSSMEEPLRELILENLAVGRAEEVGRWLNTFIENISAGAIAGVGLLLLFYSAISLLVNSEKAFNRIWGIPGGRPLHLRLAIYWLMITVGPILLGASVSLTAQLQRSAFAGAVVAWLPWGLGTWLISIGTTLANCGVFVLAYMIVPNTRVRLRPALLGGIVAGLLWTATKSLFIGLSASFVKYSAVYGALGALPLLMLWIYYSWVIVLFGVTFTYANQTVSSGKLRRLPARLNESFRELVAVRLMVEIARDFIAEQPVSEVGSLTNRLGLPDGVVRQLIATLTRQGLIIQTTAAEESGYLPARDIHTLTVGDIVDALRSSEGETLELDSERDDEQRVQQLLERADAASREILTSRTLHDLACESP